MSPKQILNRPDWTVADAEPDEFRRVPKQKAALLKIRVLRDDHESVLLGVIPDRGVGGILQPDFPHMRATRVEIAKKARKSRREILVEQELHAGSVASLRSRSAAKARQARMSSSVRSGNSFNTS